MSKAAKASKPKWAELGTVRTRTNKEGKKVSYLVLNKNVTIAVDGEEVDLGDYRTVNFIDPMPALESLLDGGHIDQDEYDKRVAFNEEKGVKYRATIPPKSAE